MFSGKGIDLDRVTNDKHLVAEELLCAICQGLLWKPHSCASCQHLFCRACIQTWRTINPHCCPYRCTPYEEKRAPPAIQSLLSRLSIRCRNASFGCQETLPYNALEQHETVQCTFLTQTCSTCEQDILVEELEEHQRGCQPSHRQCIMCKSMIDRDLFVEHLTTCFQQNVNLVIDQIIPPQDFNEMPNADQQNLAHENGFMRLVSRFRQFILALPRDHLIGIEDVVQAQQGSYWRRIWTMLRLVAFNRSKAPQIIIRLFFGGIGFFIGVHAALWLYLRDRVRDSAQHAFVLIILLSGLLCFGLPMLLASISDAWIMLITTVLFLLSTSILPIVPVEYLRVASDDRITYAICLAVIFLFKIGLLLLRFTVWCIPSYLSAGCLAWTLIFVTFHLRRLQIHQEWTWWRKSCLITIFVSDDLILTNKKWMRNLITVVSRWIEAMLKNERKKHQVLPRFELGSLDSKSKVLTATP